MSTGISHITLSVHNLTASLEFYREILGCKLIALWKTGAYLLAENLWLCLIAFNISQENFDGFSEKIKQSGTIIWKKNKSEGDSLYFLDPNRHKLELHASSLEAMEFFV